MTHSRDHKPAVYFTIGHNRPSGGGKVVNEFVQLCIEHGYHSRLCLPMSECQEATFLPHPAPVMTVEELPDVSTENDIIVSCWHTPEEDEAFRQSTARLKVFWQHGILIPVGDSSVGERTFTDPVFDSYWNVSRTCGDYISARYGIDTYSLVQPFFRAATESDSPETRSGILVTARRGAELIPRIREIANRHSNDLTVLEGPFDDETLLNLLRRHRFFVSLDRGVQFQRSIPNIIHHVLYSVKLRLTGTNRTIFPRKKWVGHREKHLGFPVSAAQAAAEGCIVVGFAMGGGLEWMTPDNMYLAADDDAKDLEGQLEKALTDSSSTLLAKQRKALLAIGRFSSDHAWRQLKAATGGLLGKWD